MGLIGEPTFEEALAMNEAIVAFNEWRFLGVLPYPGGTLAQDVWWKEAMVCVYTAKASAEEDLEQRKEIQPPEGVMRPE